MLSWIQQSDGWHANGFHIKLQAPFRWVLTEDETPTDGTILFVAPVTGPLATTRTLTEAKREAELLVAAQHRAMMRRRHAVILLLLLGSGLLLISDSPVQNLGVLVLSAYFVIRSVGVIFGTWLWRFAGIEHQRINYQ